jgi:hypothetical protein
MNKKRKVTYLTLTVFIVICITFTVIGKKAERINDRKIHTQVRVKQLSMAIQAYVSTYKQHPIVIVNPQKDHLVSDDYNELMEYLSCVDGPDSGNDTKLNIRKQIFLPTGSNYPEEGFVDHWDTKFKIILDSNYDGKIVHKSIKHQGMVIVYSFGPNKTDDFGTNDDICAWKE